MLCTGLKQQSPYWGAQLVRAHTMLLAENLHWTIISKKWRTWAMIIPEIFLLLIRAETMFRLISGIITRNYRLQRLPMVPMSMVLPVLILLRRSITWYI